MNQVQAALSQRLIIDSVSELVVLVNKEIGAGPISLVPTEIVVFLVELHVMLLQEKLRNGPYLLLPSLIPLFILRNDVIQKGFFRERHFLPGRLGLHLVLAGRLRRLQL